MTTCRLAVDRLSVELDGRSILENLSFVLHAGETLGLVGESGAGKSTLARAILRLIPASSGRVLLDGVDWFALRAADLRARRRDVQIVFQDPLASLNPRLTVGDTLSEPLRMFEPALSSALRTRRIIEMLDRVGLAPGLLTRYPHEFSGGECQRIGIARAMMLRPKLLICDEPVSALDVSIQGQIVNLLADLQREYDMAMLFISHNLAVVRHLSHRVMVLYRGRLLEIADVDALFAAPGHPYTQALLAAVPSFEADAVRPAARPVPDRTAVSGPDLEPVAAIGCPYRSRCGYAQAECTRSAPALITVEDRRSVACHRWREVVYS